RWLKKPWKPTAHVDPSRLETPQSDPAFSNTGGVGTTLHCVPSQRAEAGAPSNPPPTAIALLLERTVTAKNPAVGIGTTVQTAPSQCIARPPRFVPPTAQTSLGAAPSTPRREPVSITFGLGISLQAVPSQCRVNVDDVF